MNSLQIKNLSANIADKQILKELSLEIPQGEVHAIMGPNGSGKSTLSKVLAGHPDYEVTHGEALMNGVNILGQDADEVARSGLFLAFQYPVEVAGVSIANFIRAALQARLPDGESIKAVDYYKELYAQMDDLGMDRKFTSRSLNDGFSGGEKKRCEILQMSMEYIVPDVVHVMWDGKIVRSGDKSLALELEEKGYDWIKEEIAA